MIKKLIDILVKIEIAAASLILIALILCTFSGAIMRYCFNSPYTWEEEFQLACMVWITFLGAPAAFHTKSHVAIEILVDLFPKKLQQIMDVLIAVAVWAVLIYFFFRSIDFVSVIAGTSRSTPMLKIPYAWIYGVAPVSVVLMLISYTYMTVLDIREKSGAHKEVDPE